MENPTDFSQTPPRALGMWLRTVDHLLAREFEAVFEAEGITRREWRVLTLLDDTHGDEADGRFAEIRAHVQRHGGKKLRRLAERGWATRTDDTWTLTEEGRAARARMAERIDAVRAKITAAAPEADLATTTTTLQAIAHELGWDPSQPMPRGFGRRGPRRGTFGPFGPAAPFGAGAPFGGFGPGHHGRGHGRGHGHDCTHRQDA